MYITVDELGVPEDLLIRITDDEGSGMVNEGRALSAIADAQARIDAALSARFDTPLNSPGGMVRSLARDIAVHGLYLRVGAVPEDVARAYDRACEVLDRAAEGLFHLGLEGPSPGPGVVCMEREFDRESMSGF